MEFKNLTWVCLSFERIENDVNGNPMYRIGVMGINRPNLPKLNGARVNRRTCSYTVQSHTGHHATFAAFVAEHGSLLNAIGRDRMVYGS